MASFVSVLLMAALLGAASFGVGILPLSVTFSKSSLAALTAFGTGLLLGAALGVIIPEGVAAVVAASAQSPGSSSTRSIALSLILGFIFMLGVERQFSHSAHVPLDDASSQQPKPADVSSVEFDVELGELERTEGAQQQQNPNILGALSSPNIVESQKRAYPLTLGLVVHALADGLALGSAALSEPGSEATGGSLVPSGLSLVVFIALVIHKAPTALALTTSLLSTSLPVGQCRRHLAIFSAATPVGTLVSYVILSFFGANGRSQWPGNALLFSGGSFLYVATVLQPSLTRAHFAGEEIRERIRLFLTILGVLTPYLIAMIFGNDHEHL